MLNKTRLALLLLVLVTLLIAACGNDNSADDNSADDNSADDNSADDNSADNNDIGDVAQPATAETAGETDAATETPLDLSSVSGDDALAFADPFAPIEVTLPEQTVQAGTGALLIDMDMPDGYKLNNLAPQQVAISVDGVAVAVPETWADYSAVEPLLPLIVPLTLTEGQATITGALSIYWCEAIKEELCFINDAELTIPVTVMADATSSDIVAAIPLTPPLQ